MATETNVRPAFQRSRWLPIAAMILLIVMLGGYTRSQEAAFLSSFNLNGAHGRDPAVGRWLPWRRRAR